MKQDIRPLELDGLCMTCDHAHGCAYLARTEGPIWTCEEFDDSGKATPGAVIVAEPRARRSALEVGRHETGKPLGLCRNCDNHPSCGLPGASEGVWFCEEYR